ncbi:phosphotransferase family protein [Streptomyces stelliscabiei]|uniref:phosphotransferase family protein n=1 Tax=Streptomyces stelliscabiei TaxID=146820 RepID=UPI0029B1879B|nr:aminoglycoside phosphotransferase family protein [Streptomyces stelliscabiei]MDX2552457.1 aminoglycoside phosphotransferase family protein [Streptomyces stelliscabiei]MDX2611852.1 aminoglycoside phosphotransferase family protein [Streptomyces stelliscabiei]MDX2637199.1 aminoglycoside phosphotransferase family protein [Streptomyces stelliscabiei]MDX2660618.1 aminoglycoside phosphotransferase family protein [Streptomyces stelliscabiei]MDX2714932.1 aminoglycoside phosphotransferase family prot
MDDGERARLALAAAGLAPGALAERLPLGGGTYNTVEELRLTDGTRLILKIPPPSTTPGLTYESELLGAEAEFCRAAETVGVPAPRVVAAALDASAPTGRHLLLTHCPGGGWEDLEPAEEGPVRRELGGLVARLHRVTGPGFGYPSGAFGPLTADWRTAFAALYDGILADARRYGAWLPLPVDEVARTARAAYDALDDVTVPRLVHFDLWPGNILVERGGTPRVGALIDGERMFWGDPVADFVSLALLGDIRRDSDFLTGYQEAGGEIEFTQSARRRYALYRSYLYLIMLVEAVPRALDDGHLAWRREAVAPQLTGALEELRALS